MKTSFPLIVVLLLPLAALATKANLRSAQNQEGDVPSSDFLALLEAEIEAGHEGHRGLQKMNGCGPCWSNNCGYSWCWMCGGPCTVR